MSIERWKKAEALRRAEVAYLTDDTQQSAEYWWEQLCGEFMALPEFRQHVQHGRWVARREKYWAGITQAALRKQQKKAVADLTRSMQELQQVRQNTLELIQPRIINGQKVYRVQPSSYEGVVRAIVLLDQQVDAKTQLLLQNIEPDLVREMGKTESVFSVDEVRGVARMLLEARRAKQTQAMLPAAAVIEMEEEGEEDAGEGEDD